MIESFSSQSPQSADASVVEERRIRNHRAAAMLQRWLDEPVDERDEQYWPLVEEALKRDPIRFGELDETHS